MWCVNGVKRFWYPHWNGNIILTKFSQPYRKLSKWQLRVQPVMNISTRWRHFNFSAEIGIAILSRITRSILIQTLFCLSNIRYIIPCYNGTAAWQRTLYLTVMLPKEHYNDVTLSVVTSKIGSVLRLTTKNIKFCIAGHPSGAPIINGFPSQRASNAEHVSMSWRHRYTRGSGRRLLVHRYDNKSIKVFPSCCCAVVCRCRVIVDRDTPIAFCNR